MSQKKTVFPGVGSEGDFQPNPEPLSAGAYSRPSGNRHAGTVFPGMEGYAAPQVAPNTSEAHRPAQAPAGKPIVGFLYSVSRTGVGEYWPLHVGQNLIGRSPECDIVLPEGTVSARHASLHINIMKKPEKTEATISHLGATNGIEVNENSVSMARPMECVDGDIITVGEAYRLLLLLIDTKALGLGKAENFIPIETEEEAETAFPSNSYTPQHAGGRETRNEQDFPPRFEGPSASPTYGPYSGSTDGTVGLDPSGGSFRRGGTVGN